MTQEELNQLKIGEIVINTGSGNAYVVIEILPDVVAVRSVIITNPSEWAKVYHEYT